jgi:hypothetical protein
MDLIVVGQQDAESQYGPFISSGTARSFHKPSCKWVRKILARDRIKYASHADAEAAGKKTCKTCNS